jgi:hypothetical protein
MQCATWVVWWMVLVYGYGFVGARPAGIIFPFGLSNTQRHHRLRQHFDLDESS